MKSLEKEIDILKQLLYTVTADSLGTIFNFYKKCISQQTLGTINYINIHTLNITLHDTTIRKIVCDFDLTHSDGVGFWIIHKLLIKNGLKRFNWTDNVYKYLQTIEREKWSIYFLGSTNEVLNAALIRIRDLYKNLNVVGIHNGYELNDKLIDTINSLRPDIIWVGMGSPKQEMWVAKYKSRLNSYVIQTVGDVFSELATTKVRGPKFAQKLGFEWGFRVISNPRRYSLRYVSSMFIFLKILINYPRLRKLIISREVH